MAVLNKEQLYNKIVEAITESGWQIDSASDINQQPVRIEVKKEKTIEILRIYIWNLSHGGASRPENEYRIQVKVDRFEEETNSKTLILGYWDEKKIFAGFDLSKHIGKPGWSASMQIKKEYLEEALNNKVTSYSKENGEIAIAFRPDFFMDYVNDIYDLHTTGNLNKYLYSPIEEEFKINDDTEEEVINFRFSITSYGADYPVDAIVKRIDSDVIFVPPFQRRFVWNIKEASRFIESLILGLPVPGIFLSKEDSTNRLLIIDGQQRLFSLYSFYKNNFKNKVFKLDGVQEDLNGKTFEDLNMADRNRLNDAIIHATIVKQDQPDDNDSSIYLIFERLNSSGRLLTPQEVRACVYYGDFNEYLNKVILMKDWRDIFGKMNDRMKEQEIILRFFALYFNSDKYKRPLKSFLNTFMKKNQNLQVYNLKELDEILLPTISLLNTLMGNRAFRVGGGVNAALFDSIMIGLSKRLKKSNIQNTDKVVEVYNQLLIDPNYISLIKESTSDESNVSRRIEISIQKFDLIE